MNMVSFSTGHDHDNIVNILSAARSRFLEISSAIVLNDVIRYDKHHWESFKGRERKKTFLRKLFVNIVPVDCLTLVGANASASAVMSKFGACEYKGLVF